LHWVRIVQSLAAGNPRFFLFGFSSTIPKQNLHEINTQLAAAGKSSYTAILGDILDASLMTEIFLTAIAPDDLSRRRLQACPSDGIESHRRGSQQMPSAPGNWPGRRPPSERSACL